MGYDDGMSNLSVRPVREKAKASGIDTIQELADRTGMTYPTALKWWHDKVQMVDLNMLEKLADELGCEPGELIVRKA